MIVVSSAKSDLVKNSKPIRCPKCKIGRICDATAIVQKSVRVAKEGEKADFIIKCPRCAAMIGIEIVK